MKHTLAVIVRRLLRMSGECVVIELLTVLCSEYCRTEDIRSSLYSLSSCDGVAREAFRVVFESLGFSIHYVSDDNRPQAELYNRSPQEAANEQIQVCLRKDFSASMTEARAGPEKADSKIEYPLHPVAATVGIQASKEIRKSVGSNFSRNIQWNPSTRFSQSAPVLLYIYSVKSQSTLKFSAFPFFSFYAVTFSFYRGVNKFMVDSGRTIRLSFFDD